MPGESAYTVRIAKEAGLDGVQLELGSYENGYPMAQPCVHQKYMEDAKTYGIEFPSLVLNDLCKFGFVNGKNTDHGKIAYDMLRIGIETAAKMGIGVVMVPSFFDNFIIEEKHYEAAVEALTYSCDLAGKYSIAIASETVIAPENHLRILDKVNRKNLGIFFDSMNYKFFSKLNQIEVFNGALPRMAPQLHIKDGVADLSAALLGEGDMDFFAQAELIRASSFTGWIILENYYSHLPIRGNSDTDQLELMKKDIAVAKKALGR